MTSRFVRFAVAAVIGTVAPLLGTAAVGSTSSIAAGDRSITAAADAPAALAPDLAGAAPTSIAPTPPTTAAPAPPPAPDPAPPSPPPAPSPPPPPPPPADPLARVNEAYVASVPEQWRATLTVRFELIDGTTSLARTDGTILVGSYHANGSWVHLRTVLAHEFGHQIAFSFGSGQYLGAAPEGWPYAGPEPAEAWADCVSEVFTGIVDPSHGLPRCPTDSRDWAAAWLAGGPG